MSVLGYNESTTIGKKVDSSNNNQNINNITTEDIDFEKNYDNDLGEMDFSDIASNSYLEDDENLLNKLDVYEEKIDRNIAEMTEIKNELEAKKAELEANRDRLSSLDVRRKELEIKKLELQLEENNIEYNDLVNEKRKTENKILEKPIESKTKDELNWEKNRIDDELEVLSRQKEYYRDLYERRVYYDREFVDRDISRQEIDNIKKRQIELNMRKEEIDNQINRLNSHEGSSGSSNGGAPGGGSFEGHPEGHGSGSDSGGSTHGGSGAAHNPGGVIEGHGSGTTSPGGVLEGHGSGSTSPGGVIEGHESESTGGGHGSSRVVEGPSPERMKGTTYNVVSD